MIRELLLFFVVAVFGGAILYRAMEPRRQYEYRAACSSNLIKIYSAISLYAKDFDDTLPRTWFGKDAGPSNAETNYKWMDAIAPYAKADVFNCPADKGRSKYRFRDGNNYGSYVFNNAYYAPGDKQTPPAGLALSKIDWMSSTILLLDGDNAFQFAWPDARSTPVMTVGLPRRLDSIITRHHDVSMQLYVDGHFKGNRLDYIAQQRLVGGQKIYTGFTIEGEHLE